MCVSGMNSCCVCGADGLISSLFAVGDADIPPPTEFSPFITTSVDQPGSISLSRKLMQAAAHVLACCLARSNAAVRQQAMAALQVLDRRATVELRSEVLLVTRALKRLVQDKPEQCLLR